MKKRIYFSMMLLTVISLLLAATALCFVFYDQFSKEVQKEIRERAQVFTDDTVQGVLTELADFKPADMRITLIEPDGTVVFDNEVGTEGLSSHLDREEVREAIETGFGESKRFSDTLKQETYYYSVKLADGSILRIAKTINSIFSVFGGSLPIVVSVVLVMIIIGYFLAGSLTRIIVKPINNVGLNSDLTAPYDELAPFVRTIAQQREYIAQQLSDIQNRSNTTGAIMDNMSEGIVLVNKQGVILSVNKSAAAIFMADTSMDGKNILELIRDVELLKNVREALSGNRAEMSMEQSGKTYRVFISPVTDSGAMILLLDITEKTMSEKMRREFSANVSHELRTPLTSIYGHAEMLYNGMVKEDDHHEFFGKMKDEAARLMALIEDIIMISKLDEGKEDEAFEDVDVAAIAAETIESLSMKAGENKVSLNCVGKGVVLSNRSMMYEMFYNLIDNAIKYNKPGGTVKVEICQMEKQTKIVVADTGIGIPEEAQNRIFERFYRVDKSRSKKTGGTGLGLAIVKHIVLVHGGQIMLKSCENEGTVITVTFFQLSPL